MIAAARRTIIHRIARNAFVNFVGKNERLHIWRSRVAPRARVGRPLRAGRSAVIRGRSVRTHVQLAAVVPLPEFVADRIDAGKETVPSYAHLPLCRTSRTAGKCHCARTV